MARNMYVTVLADTKDFTNKMKGAGRTTDAFGKLVKGVGSAGLLAFAGMAVGLANMIPDMIRAGEEAAKMEARLSKVVDNTGLFGKATERVTGRLKEFARVTMLNTAIDDEVIMGVQAKLLAFDSLAKKADDSGRAMDRATKASLDLAAFGLGSAESAAVKLGKMLQNPVDNLNALAKGGIVLSDSQKEHIRNLEEQNRKYEAQDYILDIIEGKVGGLSETQASNMDKLNVRFADMGETIGGALLPAVDAVAVAMSDWLDDPANKAMFDSFVGDIEDFAKWVASPEGAEVINGFLTDAAGFAGDLYDAFKRFIDWINSEDGKATIDKMSASINTLGDAAKWAGDMFNSDGWRFLFGSDTGYDKSGGFTPGNVPDTTSGTTTSTTDSGKKFKPSNVVVNFNAPVDSVSAGREVARVLNDYKRANGGL